MKNMSWKNNNVMEKKTSRYMYRKDVLEQNDVPG